MYYRGISGIYQYPREKKGQAKKRVRQKNHLQGDDFLFAWNVSI
jgi:hypothetical protein